MSDAAKWHDGCSNDAVRNKFIIPEIVSSFSKHQVNSAVFVGSATGYIPHKVALSHSLHRCVLIDIDNDRLEYSRTLDYTLDAEFSNSNFCNWQTIQPLDCVVLSNTLLEFPIKTEFLKKTHEVLRGSGVVLIFLPDTLEDIEKMVSSADTSPLKNYISGVHPTTKRDKFTGKDYNFYAHRFLYVIKLFLEHGFSLQDVSTSKENPRCIKLELVK